VRRAEEALRHEAEVLDFAHDVARSAVLPRVVGLDIDERGTLLLLTAVSGSRLGNRDPFTARHVRLISELHERRRPLDGAALRDALKWRVDEEPDSAHARFLSEALQSTTDLWPAVRAAHFSHGDLTPWNCLNCGAALGVVDWETAGYRIPGWDVLHYHVQIESITRTGQPARAADRILRHSSSAAARDVVLAAADIDLPKVERWRALQLLGLIEGAVDLLATQPNVSRRGIEVRTHTIARILGVAPPALGKAR